MKNESKSAYTVSTVRETKRRKRTVVRTPHELARLIWSQVTRPGQEHMFAVIVNTKNEVLACELMTLGTVNAQIVHPTQAFKVFFEQADNGATGLFLAHNHPTGDTEPSVEDIKFTKRMQLASHILGIELMDHVIVGSNDIGGFNLYSIRGSGSSRDWIDAAAIDAAVDRIWSS